MINAISTEGLTKKIGWWKPKAIVDNLDLRVGEGKIFGMLGQNGAGKTTTFKLLLGLTHISSGTARLFDIPVPTPLSRAKVGYLPEVVNHPDYLTVEEYLTYHAQMAGLKDIRERMGSRLGRLGLPNTGHLFLGTLSKGMRQRIDLARVMMLDARLILLDEPVSGLDPLGQASLKEILLDLKRDGMSIILNSHAVGIMSDLCDEIGIMSQGKLIRSGTLDCLLKTDRWKVVFRCDLPDPLMLIPDRKPDDRASCISENTWKFDLSARESLNSVFHRMTGKGEILEAGRVRLTLEELFSQTLSPIVGSQESISGEKTS